MRMRCAAAGQQLPTALLHAMIVLLLVLLSNIDVEGFIQGIMRDKWVSEEEACSCMKQLVEAGVIDMHQALSKQSCTPAEAAFLHPKVLQTLIGLKLQVGHAVLFMTCNLQLMCSVLVVVAV